MRFSEDQPIPEDCDVDYIVCDRCGIRAKYVDDMCIIEFSRCGQDVCGECGYERTVKGGAICQNYVDEEEDNDSDGNPVVFDRSDEDYVRQSTTVRRDVDGFLVTVNISASFDVDDIPTDKREAAKAAIFAALVMAFDGLVKS